jgi:ankyrin repeat protein
MSVSPYRTNKLMDDILIGLDFTESLETEDINFTNGAGFNALHYACHKHSYDTVLTLLEHGADPKLGLNPMQSLSGSWLAFYHVRGDIAHSRITEILLIYGAPPCSVTRPEPQSLESWRKGEHPRQKARAQVMEITVEEHALVQLVADFCHL